MQPKFFIAHAKTTVEDFKALKKMLEYRHFHRIDDYAVESVRPINREEWPKIKERIKNCDIFILLAGAFGENSEAIKKEIKVARSEGMPILVVERRSGERLSTLRYLADEIVPLDADAIVKSLRKLAGEK